MQGATLGPLIHNPQLIAELASNGIACKDSLEQFAPGETVIFRSHGEGPETYAQAEKQGLTILDATCPNVRLAQQKAAQAAADGYFPVIVGEKNHPEVKSILKWAGKKRYLCRMYKRYLLCTAPGALWSNHPDDF